MLCEIQDSRNLSHFETKEDKSSLKCINGRGDKHLQPQVQLPFPAVINPSQVVPHKPEIQYTAVEPIATTRPIHNPPAISMILGWTIFVCVSPYQIELS